MRSPLVALLLGAVLAAGGCGGADDGGRQAAGRTTGCVAGTNVGKGERALSPAELERLCARQEPGAAAAPGPARGRRVFARAGCLACHALAGAGNDGPGPALDGIGDRLPGSAIRRALVSPTPPMPAYDHLSRKDLDGLVAYLAAQRAGRP